MVKHHSDALYYFFLDLRMKQQNYTVMIIFNNPGALDRDLF